MPILERIASIEDESGQYVEISPILPSDLVPEAEQYRFGPGDVMDLRIRDFFNVGAEDFFEIVLDPRGYISIPRLPPVRAQGLTTPELTIAIENAIRDARIQDNPIVSINVRGQRKQTFSVLGSVAAPGTFFHPAPDYRLLEGLTAAGGFAETVPYVYVIRQIPLSEAAAGELGENGERPVRPRTSEPTPSPDDNSLIDLIDELSKPSEEQPSPGMMDSGGETGARRPRSAMRAEPPIDLPDPARPASPEAPSVAPEQPVAPKSDWVYIDGQWVRKARGGGGMNDAGALVTQRVIEIPTAPLLAGAADVNIVLRPGDVVRVPPAKSGLVYLAGQVSRPGPYNLPFEGKLTLRRAIVSAGGLGSLAIPERVDLTRVIGPSKQATVMVNFRAIEEGTQPDIYLKPDDIVNVGSNFWADPLAVIRNGFRFTYGFGFVLDRNFSEDVYGPQSIRN